METARVAILKCLARACGKKGVKEMMYYSSDFQCPETGIPVALVYDDENYHVSAEICEALRDSWTDLLEDKELEEETEKWCTLFCEIAFDLDEANEIAEKYECWFS
jgi:hypothetical protein